MATGTNPTAEAAPRRAPSVIVNLLLSTLVLTACANHGGGLWTGTVTAMTVGPTCKSSQAMLTITKDAVTFAPDSGTWLLNGTASADGSITAERITQGASRQPFETRLSGRWTATSVEGTYTTPRCNFTVHLTRR